MIIVKLRGGFGNQLFQYAFGRKIALQNRQNLYLDTSAYHADYLRRQCSLAVYNIKASFADGNFFQKIINRQERLNWVLRKVNFLEEKVEESFSFKAELLNTNKLITIYTGFWQSFKYFDDIRKILLDELTSKSAVVAKISEQLNFDKHSVAVHVRRTDYLQHPSYGFLGMQYYLDAIKLMKSKIKAPCFFVFSDDITWCRSNFPDDLDVTYISQDYQLKDYEELELMSKCYHHIIANSSFSWWGAWLCQNNNQIVVRPLDPFKDPSLLYESHYPDNWNKAANKYEFSV